ncbi:beta-ketoacyl synthase N-terminal-like domain-containing protein [Streptomyces sp. NPDC008150]|uniref:beta-ketoacyl synthase N-terminal-like domain-containing protein n=1 Tax=Streptomyces sp. NPDC008150 TaxID=3364816 RepID=UPI0036E09800
MPSEPGTRHVPVVVTGTGVISPAGLGTARLWEAMAAGKTFFGTGDHDGPAPALPWPSAAVDTSEIGWPEGRSWADASKYANQSARWAVAVARQALEQAGIDGAVEDVRGGTVMAVGSSGDELSDVIPRLASRFRKDPRPLAKFLHDEVPDYSYIRGIPSQLGQFVSMASGFRGSNVAAYGEAAAGGTGALALAARLLESGELDRVLVVGVGAPLSVTSMAAFDQDDPFGTRATAGAGPFDTDRAGTLVGQGAAAVLLERADLARGPALARFLGCEVLAAADAETASALAVDAVLGASGRAPTVWWAHGAGSPHLDAVEARTVLGRTGAGAGAAGAGLPVTGSKGTIGNAFECSALIDTALTVESLGRRELPPIGLLRRADPLLAGLDPVLGEPRPLPADATALLTAFNQGRGASAAGAVVLAAEPVTGEART